MTFGDALAALFRGKPKRNPMARKPDMMIRYEDEYDWPEPKPDLAEIDVPANAIRER